jgi:MEMO1 family protein
VSGSLVNMKKIFLIPWLLLCMVPPGYGANLVKRPNVAGQFYPANPKQLSAELDDVLAAAPVEPSDKAIEVLIAPHAGYPYSASVAAYAYKAASNVPVKTVVVLAPSHYYGFPGVSVWPSGSFQTPLGDVEVDESFATELLKKNKQFVFEPRIFEKEHSLEVQLPFLQKTFSGFKIVPIIMGQTSLNLTGDLAQALDEIIGTRKGVLIVASSDMSHFHEASFAQKMDGQTIETIKKLDADYFWKGTHSGELEMCGAVPVTTALLYAKRRGLAVDFLHYAHSGNVTGDRKSVVGYSTFVFFNKGAVGKDKKEAAGKEAPPLKKTDDQTMKKENASGVLPLSVEQKKRLLEIATQTVATLVKTGKTFNVAETDPRLTATEGAFVTIHKQGQLRGCIGHIVTQEPLYLTVRDMAVAAASQDPRFQPVKSEELGKIDIEISVLSQPRPAKNVDEIKMGVHGVIVRRGPFHTGVFLPQVATETGWSREEFLSQLCSQKAGLPADAWKDPKTVLEIFTADVFSEKDLK